jgi:hypothetical protein
LKGFAERTSGSRIRLKELLDALASEAGTDTRRSSWSDEAVSQTPRQLLRRREEDVEADWIPPRNAGRCRSTGRDQHLPPSCCPRCKTEVLVVMQPVPGAADIQSSVV